MNAFKKTLVAIAAAATLGATGLASTQASANGYGYDIVTVGMAAGMATTANPRTATTAIPPTATALMVMAIGATAMATAAATGNGRISRLPSLTPGSRRPPTRLGGTARQEMEARGAHALFPRELRPGQTRLTREPSRAVDRQTHEDHSLNRRQEPGHATSSHRLALSSRYCGSPGFGRLCRYPARIGSGPNHRGTALDLPKAFARTCHLVPRNGSVGSRTNLH